jgi:hypothetical protein
MRDVAVQRGHRCLGGLLSPDPFDQATDRHHPPGVEHEHRQHGPAAHPAERDDLAVSAHFERAQQAELEHGAQGSP